MSTHSVAPDVAPDVAPEVTPQTGAGLALYVDRLTVQAPNGKVLLHPLSFTIPDAQFTAIVGASGCGKSTLLRTLSGLAPASAGRILLQGMPLDDLRHYYPYAVGCLPQFTSCYEDLTVREILQHACRLRLPSTIDPQRCDAWCQHLIKLTGCAPFLPQRFKTLSGGQMRRVALLEELVGDPPFLFLDELTSGLDPYADFEIMTCLNHLSEALHKSIFLVTHNPENLNLCHTILFLHEGKLCFQGRYVDLLAQHETESIVQLFGAYQEASRSGQFKSYEFPLPALPEAPAPKALRQSHPAHFFTQFFTLVERQATLLGRDSVQIVLHIVIIITFPLLVVIFALNGLPAVEHLTLQLNKDIVGSLISNISYLKQAFHTATLVSGLTMFQVILLTLMGANNGSREIAKEHLLLRKELHAGLSPLAYLASKVVLIGVLCLVQAAWMAWFVKTICGFPGSLLEQFGILFAVTLAMSSTCLAISSASANAERASLLSIVLVGLQLPLSGAILALPDLLGNLTRPFIAAYWGWSGYLKTLANTPHYDIVQFSTDTWIADYSLALAVLGFQTVVSLAFALFQISRAGQKIASR